MTNTVPNLTKMISTTLEWHGLAPQREQIARLVQEHYDAFVDGLLAECGLTAASTGLRDYVCAIDDVKTMEFVVRHHAAILEKLRQEQDTLEVFA